MSDEHPITRRTVLRGAGASALAAIGLSTPAAAEHQTFWEKDDPTGGAGIDRLTFIRAAASGVLDRVRRSRDPASKTANDVADFIDETGTDWVQYVNDRKLGGQHHQVLEMTFAPEGGGGDTRYIVADWDEDSGGYTSVTVVEDTGRDPDLDVQLESFAAENAADELREFHERFVLEDEDPDSEYVSKVAGRYSVTSSHHITGSLVGDLL